MPQTLTNEDLLALQQGCAADPDPNCLRTAIANFFAGFPWLPKDAVDLLIKYQLGEVALDVNKELLRRTLASRKLDLATKAKSASRCLEAHSEICRSLGQDANSEVLTASAKFIRQLARSL